MAIRWIARTVAGIVPCRATTNRKSNELNNSMYGLTSLIAPLALNDFVDHHHGRRAVLVEGQPGKFEDLCGWSDITHLLNHGGLHYPDAKFVLNKEPLAPDALQRADYWLRQGATLIINSIQMLDPVIAHLGEALGRDMNTHINTNCYVSWPSKQGFDKHFDRHDVFILHLEGEKKWKVFEPTIVFPLEVDKRPKGEPPEQEPYLECTMTPGDVMYIPRGHWHYAVAETPSIHLTVGPSSRSGIDFLAWLTTELMDRDEFLRRDFPVVDAALLGGGRDDAALLDHLRRFRESLNQALDEDLLIGSFIKYSMTTNPIRRFCPLPGYVTLADDWDRGTRFSMNPTQKALLRYDGEKKQATVLVRGHVLNVEEVPEALLTHLFSANGPVSGSDLLEVCPDLKWKKLRKFLLQLFEIGVIVQTDE